MSLASIGSDARYILPASYDSVPEAFRSNKSAKPIPCSLQTVNLPSLSGQQGLGGSSIIQVPCGASAGYMANPYLRFTIQLKNSAKLANAVTFDFKGAVKAATACISRYSTFVNSQQVDNLQNAWALYDLLLAHSTSQPWLDNDGRMMLGAGITYTQATERAAGNLPPIHVCVPLLGLLGSQSALPLFLINGTLQIQLDFQANLASFLRTSANGIDGVDFKDVQLVYDKISCEQAFVDSVRADMMKGNKFVFGYTNYQLSSLAIGAGQNATFNYGLNVSSLRAVTLHQYKTTNLTTSTEVMPSVANRLNNFQVSLDGRMISNVSHNTVTTPAVSFSELQKCMGRLFDASISETSGGADTRAIAIADTEITYPYQLERFAIGASAQRINEGLAFSGTPCSVASLQLTEGATADVTAFITFISDQQILVDESGGCSLVR